MSDRLVRYEAREGVALIELDAPPANSYSYEMMRQLDEAVLQARFDDGVCVEDGETELETSFDQNGVHGGN